MSYYPLFIQLYFSYLWDQPSCPLDLKADFWTGHTNACFPCISSQSVRPPLLLTLTCSPSSAHPHLRASRSGTPGHSAKEEPGIEPATFCLPSDPLFLLSLHVQEGDSFCRSYCPSWTLHVGGRMYRVNKVSAATEGYELIWRINQYQLPQTPSPYSFCPTTLYGPAPPGVKHNMNVLWGVSAYRCWPGINKSILTLRWLLINARSCYSAQ